MNVCSRKINACELSIDVLTHCYIVDIDDVTEEKHQIHFIVVCFLMIFDCRVVSDETFLHLITVKTLFSYYAPNTWTFKSRHKTLMF